MALRVAINGYGRIGRNLLRAYFENGADPALEFVAINDLGKAEALAHLTRYDSTHGRFGGQVELAGDMLHITAPACGWASCGTRRTSPGAAALPVMASTSLADAMLEAMAEAAAGVAPEAVPGRLVTQAVTADAAGGSAELPVAPTPGGLPAAGGAAALALGRRHAIRLLSEPAPDKLPWAELGVDIVLECTGQFRSRRDAERHLAAGAKRVIIGAAPFDAVDAMVVYGVNHDSIRNSDRILSSVSCTTNALVPLVKILDEAFGVASGLMTEIHAVTSDQVPLDHTHRDLRRGRAAGSNIIPTTSSSIGALRTMLPGVGAHIDGYSLRVPTQNVAVIDFSFVAKRALSVEAVNAAFAREAAGAYRHILSYCDEPLVSSDFNHSPYSLVLDATETRVVGQQAKVLAWYDNEWGYANRLLDLCHYLAGR